MAQVRIATIGTSMITGQFLEALRYVDEGVFAGAYSRSIDKAQEYAKAHGADKCWDDLDELAADPDVDAVYIASPNLLHADQAIKMIGAGKSVLVEKPFCTTRHEAEAVMKAARDKGVVAMEAMRLAHDPAYRAIRAALPKLGRIRRVDLRYGKYSSRYDLVLAGKQTNIFDPNFATGALMDLGIYPVNALVLLFGEPDDLMCFADTIDVSGDGDLIDVCGSAIFSYDGHIAEVSYSKVTNDFAPCQIEGEKGTMVFSSVSLPNDVEIRYLDGTVEKIAAFDRNVQTNPEVSNMEFEIRDFCRAVQGSVWPEQANRNTLVSLGILDTVRLREGIVFPHDENAL